VKGREGRTLRRRRELVLERARVADAVDVRHDLAVLGPRVERVVDPEAVRLVVLVELADRVDERVGGEPGAPDGEAELDDALLLDVQRALGDRLDVPTALDGDAAPHVLVLGVLLQRLVEAAQDARRDVVDRAADDEGVEVRWFERTTRSRGTVRTFCIG